MIPLAFPTPLPAQNHSPVGASSPAAPFIIQDTLTDSPGTNIVTRIVTFTAHVGGSPPLIRQWKVDLGRGFVPILGATNATLRIGNAQPSDSGRYALFASNPAGQIHTTPVPLVVIDGVD